MAEPWQTGTTIGPYRLDHIIGRGGLGQVWLARDTRLLRPVAVKIIGNKGAGGAAAERFSREARALANLNHPSIVQIYDTGNEDGFHYIVTEFVDGLDLAALISQGRTCLNWAIHIAKQIVEAVMAAHSLGIVHRDIKPSNILIDAHNDRAKLTDFGLAKGAAALNTVTTAGVAVGTPAYMSPEQLAAEETGPVSDIYSLGATLYYLFTGHQPRVVTSLYSLVKEASTRRPPPPRSLRPEIPAKLSDTLMSMLEPKPRNRLPCLGELLHGLDEAAKNLGAPQGRTLWERAIEAPVGRTDEDVTTAVVGQSPSPKGASPSGFFRGVLGRGDAIALPNRNVAEKRIAFWLVGRMFREGLDVFLPMAVDDAIDAVVRRVDGSFIAVRIEVSPADVSAGEAAFFTAIPHESRECWFVFYAERMDAMWIMNLKEFMAESDRNRIGRNKGKYSIRFNDTRIDRTTGRKVDICKERFRRYLALDFQRLRNG